MTRAARKTTWRMSPNLAFTVLSTLTDLFHSLSSF